MNKKLYCAKTHTGYAIELDATLEYLQNKFEFSLNDLVEADILKVGQKLSRKIKIKTTSELYNMLANTSQLKHYLITIERTL